MVPTDAQIDTLVHDCLGDDDFDVRTVVRAALERWGYSAYLLESQATFTKKQ